LQDLLLHRSSGGPALLLADGHGGFRSSDATQVRPTRGLERALAVGDINNDGIPDLAVAEERGNAVVFLVGRRDGSYVESTLPVQSPPHALAFADLNHNGKADLVITSRESRNVTILL